jgi:hypothetical protein
MIYGEMSDQRLNEIEHELEGVLLGVTLGTFDRELIAGLEAEKRKSKLLEGDVALLRTPAAIGLDRAELLAAINILIKALESLRPLAGDLKSVVRELERPGEDSRLAYIQIRDAATGAALIDSAVGSIAQVRANWPHLSTE